MVTKVVTKGATVHHVHHHHHLGEPGVDYMDVLMWAIIAAALVIAFLA